MITDRYDRRLNYLRISVTDKCNLRCTYCMPSDGVKILPHDEILRNEEFIHFIGIFSDLGVEKIRLTGGEPLKRKGFIDIVSKIREHFPHLEICITTNGVLLDEFIKDFYSLKVRKLNISLDTINPDRYQNITRKNYFNRVISNINMALNYNYFDIKINAVLFEESLKELNQFLDFFKEKDITIRYIERMPFLIDDDLQTFISSDVLIETLRKMGDLKRDAESDTNVAVMFNFFYQNKYRMRIGIIPSISHKFCTKCNRLRLTCDGFLKTCLHSSVEYDLKTPYRMDMGDEALKDIILTAINDKEEGHNLNCPEKNNWGCSSIKSSRFMSRMGG